MATRFTPRVLVVALLAAFACLAVVVFAAAPWRSAGGTRAPILTVEPPEGDAAIVVQMTFEGLDPAKDTGRARIAIAVLDEKRAGTDWVVASTLQGARYMRPGADGIAVPVITDVPLTGGGISDYPWDGYRAEVAFASGHEATPDVADIPVRLVLEQATYGFGFVPSGVTGPRPDAPVPFTGFDATITRSPGPFAWAATMMMLYWLVALLVMAVAVLVLTGWREFEGSRHLSWMSATLFALVAFRNAAPGAPPIGVYFDWAAYFWAVGIVASSLVAVVLFSLLSRRFDARAGKASAP